MSDDAWQWMQYGPYRFKAPRGWTDESQILLVDPDARGLQSTLLLTRVSSEGQALGSFVEARKQELRREFQSFQCLTESRQQASQTFTCSLVADGKNVHQHHAYVELGEDILTIVVTGDPTQRLSERLEAVLDSLEVNPE